MGEASDVLFPDNIFALSSGHLPSGVAVIRMSGPGVRFALETFFGRIPAARVASYGSLHAPDGSHLDSGLAVYFPEPRSFTGEDCAEFHIHGGRAVVAALLSELGKLRGFRMAEAGEFTRRAFLHGRIDLTGAEALADLISAETESQRRMALENAQGAQFQLYEGWRSRLLHARALLEAELDFSDEGDVPGSAADSAWADMRQLHQEIGSHIAGFSRAEIVRDGVRVVILGAPNSGKSTLLNALARRDVAIVSDEPGTTRDLVEVALDLGGVKVILTDTAGIREPVGPVESAGIARARDRAAQAHLVLFLEDTSEPVNMTLPVVSAPIVSVGTKTDRPSKSARSYDHLISAREGIGVAGLLERLTAFAREAAGSMGETLPSRVRHVQHLAECRRELGCASDGAALDLELRAEHLRRAADALARIVGSMDVEDLLGAIFAEFCIGK